MTSMEESGPGREDVLDAPLLLSVNDGQTLPFRREWTYSEFLFLPTGPTKGLPFTCRELLGRLVLVLLFYTVLLGPPGIVL